MAIQEKILGSVPVPRGAYQDGYSYDKYNIVTLYGCSFWSKIDDNTSVPATISEENKLVVNNNWELYSDSFAAYMAGEKFEEQDAKLAELSSKHISDLDTISKKFILGEAISLGTSAGWYNSEGVYNQTGANCSDFIDTKTEKLFAYSGRMSGSNPIAVGFSDNQEFICSIRSGEGKDYNNALIIVPDKVEKIKVQSASNVLSLRKVIGDEDYIDSIIKELDNKVEEYNDTQLSVNEINNNLNSYSILSSYEIPTGTITAAYIDNDGNLFEKSSAKLSDFIPSEGIGAVFYSGVMSKANPLIIGFDSEKKFIQGILGSGEVVTNKLIGIPNEFKYIRAQSTASLKLLGIVNTQEVIDTINADIIEDYEPSDEISDIEFTKEFMQSDGTIISHESCFLSGYLSLEPGIYYISGVVSGTNMLVAGFDDENNFIYILVRAVDGNQYSDKAFFITNEIKKIRIQSINSKPIIKKSKHKLDNLKNDLYSIGDDVLGDVDFTNEWVNSTGEVASHSSVKLSDYVTVKTGDVFYVTGQMSGTNPIVVGYNSTKTFVKVLVRTENGAMLTDKEFSVPTDISYIKTQSLSSYPKLKERKTINDKIDEFPNYCTPQINQWPIRQRDISDGVRIMCFGSSFFMNTWWYLPYLLKEAGIDAEMSCFYTGGASFDQWIDRYENNTAVDCWTSTNSSDFVKTSKNFKDTLEEGWDIIGFQQGVFESRDWNTFDSTWSKLLSIIRRNCDYRTFIAFNCLWAPAKQGNLSPYESTEEGQRLWQIEANNNFKKFLALSGLSNGAVPNGATMWALRHNEMTGNENDLSGDNLHITNGLPMYAAAATWFETIISPMFNVSIDNIDWMPTEDTPKCVISSAYTAITTEHRDLIRKIIQLSQSNRFGLNEI